MPLDLFSLIGALGPRKEATINDQYNYGAPPSETNRLYNVPKETLFDRILRPGNVRNIRAGNAANLEAQKDYAQKQWEEKLARARAEMMDNLATNRAETAAVVEWNRSRGYPATSDTRYMEAEKALMSPEELANLNVQLARTTAENKARQAQLDKELLEKSGEANVNNKVNEVTNVVPAKQGQEIAKAKEETDTSERTLGQNKELFNTKGKELKARGATADAEAETVGELKRGQARNANMISVRPGETQVYSGKNFPPVVNDEEASSISGPPTTEDPFIEKMRKEGKLPPRQTGATITRFNGGSKSGSESDQRYPIRVGNVSRNLNLQEIQDTINYYKTKNPQIAALVEQQARQLLSESGNPGEPASAPAPAATPKPKDLFSLPSGGLPFSDNYSINSVMPRASVTDNLIGKNASGLVSELSNAPNQTYQGPWTQQVPSKLTGLEDLFKLLLRPSQATNNWQ